MGIDGILSKMSAVDSSKESSHLDYKIDVKMTNNVTITANFFPAVSYLESQKQPVTLTLQSIGGTHGGEAVLSAKLTTPNGFSLNTLEIPALNFNFNGYQGANNMPGVKTGSLGDVKTDSMGAASFNLSLADLNAGTYEWSASFAGNAYYRSCTAACTLVVAKAETGISAVSGNTTYDGMCDRSKTDCSAILTYWRDTGPDGGGAWTPLSGKGVEFYGDGRGLGYAITDANGLASLPGFMGAPWQNGAMVNFDAGEYPNGIRAVFTGDQNFNSSESEGDLTVNQANSFLVNVNNGGLSSLNLIKIQIQLGADFNAASNSYAVSDVYRKSGKNIVLTINGNKYTGVTDSQGIAQVNTPGSLPKGSNPYTVTFEGDANTIGSNLSGNYQVN